MSREIRRVPANWEHPKYVTERYRHGRVQMLEVDHPMFGESYVAALAEWQEGKAAFDRGERTADQIKYGVTSYEDWHGEAPDAAYYAPWAPDADLPWFQMYQTVSEGTPVTPAFATAEELIDHLTTVGETHDGEPGDGPWPRDRAEQFVRNERWFPSGVMVGGEVYTAKDGWPQQ